MPLEANRPGKAAIRSVVCPICSCHVVSVNIANMDEDVVRTHDFAQYLDKPTPCPKCDYVPESPTVVDFDKDGQEVDDDDDDEEGDRW